MANQENYKSNLQTLSEQYNKYTVSRIVATTKDNLLEMEVPANFPQEITKANIEINLYSLSDNSLIFSDFISNSITGAVTLQPLQYSNDGMIRNLLFIDFSKVSDLLVPIGQYAVSLNFFENEIGSYDNPSLSISTISPSRTEVELLGTDISELNQFALPSLNSVWVKDALKQVFNQTGSNVRIPTDNTVLTTGSIGQQMPQFVATSIEQYNFDGVYTIAQSILDGAYLAATTEVDSLLANNTTRFTNATLATIISSSLVAEYKKYLDTNTTTVGQLPYDLVVGD
jgi:hypothetical protein